MDIGLGRSRFRLPFALVLCVAFAMSGWIGALAESTEVVITGGVSTTDAGEFGIELRRKGETGCGGDLAFDGIEIDAVGGANGLTTVELAVCVAYQDTRVDRGAFTVLIRVSDFELRDAPGFEGAETAHFQIPSRYLSLTEVGAVSGGVTGDGVGEIAADPSDESSTFEGGATLRIAAAAAGSGFFNAEQELILTLAVPAGVYPGDYLATITVEVGPDL
jgi:hypothetical protein